MQVPDYDTVAERAAIATALLEGSADLAAERSVREVLKRLADLLVAASPHMRLAWIFVGDPEAEIISADYAVGPEADYGRSLSVDRSGLMMRGPVRRALASEQMVLQRIPQTIGLIGVLNQGLRRWHTRAMQAGVAAVLAFPFRLSGADEFALTVLYADQRNYFDDVGTQAFDAVGRLAGLSIERARLHERAAVDEKRLTRLSFYDPLTGLANRAYFYQRLEQLLRKAASTAGWPLVMVVLDIDDFADLNRHLGIAAGDTVLQQLAHRLPEVTPEVGIIARLANDTFASAWPIDPAGGFVIEQWLADCLACVRRPMRLDDRTVEITASIGGVVLPAPAQTTCAGLAQCAESALDHARREGGDRWATSEYDGDPRTLGRHVLMQDIKLALETDQFTLVYQPIVRLDGNTAAPIKVEALLRWRHPRRGWIAPDEFIPLVERSDFMRELGRWVLARALDDGAAWRRNGVEIAVSVNIAARQLLSPGFEQDLRKILTDADMPVPLAIEITETAALSDLAGAGEVLNACRALGVDVALDDFGSGYASWRYLEQLPVTQLKIDRRYVQRLCEQPEDLAIVAGAITSGRLLGLEVIAEGVETTEQALMASRIGCQYAQGYLISRPVAAVDMPRWAATWQLPLAWTRRDWSPVPRAMPLLFAITAHHREVSRCNGLALEPRTVPMASHQCTFDIWLRREGANLLSAQRLDSLRQSHEHFHRALAALRNDAGHSTERHGDVPGLQRDLQRAGHALMRDLHAAYGALCTGPEASVPTPARARQPITPAR